MRPVVVAALSGPALVSSNYCHVHTCFPIQSPFLRSVSRFPQYSSRARRSILNCRNNIAFGCRAKIREAEMENQARKDLKIFDSEETLATSLAEYIARLSKEFIVKRDSFTVVLSGGSLIKSLRKLLECPYFDSIEWSKWHVFWVDERVVPKDHDDSNYKLAYDGFLRKVSIVTGHVYGINDALPPEGAADDYETRLRQLTKNGILATSTASGFPKFDLMLLGMGPDGHVASLFPNHPLLHQKEKWVTFITDSPKPPPERITLTFPVINSSSFIALVVVGSGKADAVSAALGRLEGPPRLPVQMVSPEGELTWFMDRDATSKL